MLGFFSPKTLQSTACSSIFLLPLPHPPDVYQHNITFLNAEGDEESLREHVNHKEVVSLVTVTT